MEYRHLTYKQENKLIITKNMYDKTKWEKGTHRQINKKKRKQ